MRKWTYLLVYNHDFAGPLKIVRLVESIPEIVNWVKCLPNSIFIVSSLPATELTNLLIEATGKKGRFLILDTATDRNGVLPRAIWDLMKTPKGTDEM
jgi:hypothetical protein